MHSLSSKKRKILLFFYLVRIKQKILFSLKQVDSLKDVLIFCKASLAPLKKTQIFELIFCPLS
jgi:hypothetical protein